MNKLLNSAMMPSLALNYRSGGKLTAQDFGALLRAEPFESYIGYDSTARILSEIAGIEIPISRAQTTVEPGDKLLIARLKYRLADPGQKGKTEHTIEDFEFGVFFVE